MTCSDSPNAQQDVQLAEQVEFNRKLTPVIDELPSRRVCTSSSTQRRAG